MNEIERQLEQLRKIVDHNSLEFYQQLRIVLKGSYRYSLNYLSHLVEEFYSEIMENGVFYIDVLNENFLYFIKKEKKPSLLQNNLFLLIIEKILNICDRQSLDLLQFFYKKNQKKDPRIKNQAKEYIQHVQANLLVTEDKMKDYRLHVYKDIIDSWY